MLAGAVFVGLAFALSFVVVGVDALLVAKEREIEKPDEGTTTGTGNDPLAAARYILPAVSHITYLFTILSVILIFMGQLLGVNSLVNDWRPDGDFTSSSTAGGNDDVGPWYIGQAGLVWCTMAWAWGLAAAWVEGVTWVWVW